MTPREILVPIMQSAMMQTHFMSSLEQAAEQVIDLLGQAGFAIVYKNDLPDPGKLELLADWFDMHDAENGVQNRQEVQQDLRRWAAALRP